MWPHAYAHRNCNQNSCKSSFGKCRLSSVHACLQGAIMRMLTRMHLEREFKLNVPNTANKQILTTTPSASGQSMAHFPMEANLERHVLQPIQPQAA